MPKLSRNVWVGGIGVLAIVIPAFFALRLDGEAPANSIEEQSSSLSRSSKERASRISQDGFEPRLSSKSRLSGVVKSEVSGWGEIAATLTPSQAKELLDRDRLEEKNSELRAENAARIIGQLCLNGFTQEAWALIESDPGIVREKALNGFFNQASLPETEVISRLSTLIKKERLMGLTGYWNRFDPEAFVRLDLGKFGLNTSEDRVALRQTFESMLGKAFDPSNPALGKYARQDLMGFAVDQANAGVLGLGDLSKILQKDPSKDGFTYWSTLDRIDPVLRKSQDSLKGPDAVILQAMTVQDPERTLNMTLIDGSVARGKGYIALEKWLDQDFKKAEEWYQRNADRADPDGSAVAFMRACATRGNYQTALDWYAKIGSESWKNGIGGEMRSIQRRLEMDLPR